MKTSSNTEKKPFNITTNVKHTLSTIQKAAKNVNRHSGSITLVAASKTRSTKDCQAAFDAGIRHFGENYLQEGVEKILEWQNNAVTWHFIGALQSNKLKLIAQHFQWVQTLSQIKHAKKLNAHTSQKHPLQVCLQVNLDDEDSKSGLNISEVLPFALEVQKLKQLHLRGLMAIPKPGPTTSQRFTELKHLWETLQQHPELAATQLDTLSIGMSQDYELAITKGSTLLRIGTQIFGPREQKTSTVNTPS